MMIRTISTVTAAAVLLTFSNLFAQTVNDHLKFSPVRSSEIPPSG